jgi:hypothetical protein
MGKVFRYFLGDIVAISNKQTKAPRVIMIPYGGKDAHHKGCVWSGELSLGKYMNKIAVSEDRTELIGRALYKLYLKDRNILALSDRILILENLKRYLLARGIPERDVGLFTGNIKQTDRKIKLGTYGSAGLGYDDKNINAIVLCTPRADIEQAVGRLRAGGVIVDIVDTRSHIIKGYSFARLKYYKTITDDIIDKS